MKQKSILRGEENIEFIQTKELVRKNCVELKKTTELLSHERMTIMSDIFFKTMILNETRIKYSCKLLSYIIRYDYEELLENMRFTKNNFDKNVVSDKGVVGDFVTEIGDYKINIEVNVNRNESRNFHYLAKLFASKARVGSDDKNYNYNPVVQVNFNNYAYENDDKTKRIIHVSDEEGKVFLNIYIVEYYLPNIIGKMYNEGTEVLSEDERIVLAMFTEDKNLADELAKGDTVLKEFEEEVEAAMQDNDLKQAYDHFLDYGDGMRDEGFKEGLEQGIEQGGKQEKIETAKRLFMLDLKIDEIQKATELPMEVIEKLKIDNK